MAGDALAKTGATSAPTKAGAKEDAGDIEQGTADYEVDYGLKVLYWSYFDGPCAVECNYVSGYHANVQHGPDGHIEPVIEGVFPINTPNMDFCWTTDTANELPCLDNKIGVSDEYGDAVASTASYGLLDLVEHQITVWRASFDVYQSIFGYFSNGNLVGGTHEPFVCGIDYKIQLRSGPYNDTKIVNWPCPWPEFEEECIECPYGGTYDGASCYLGGGPVGTQAFVTNGYYAYSSTDGDCGSGDVVLRNGCGMREIPSEVDPFIWQDGFYYDPICE